MKLFSIQFGAPWAAPTRVLSAMALAIAMTGALLFTGASNTAFAANPDEMIKSTTESVLAEFETRRDELKADNSKLFDLVSEKVLPNMDFERMARMVLGRNWKKATPEQHAAFTAEFRTLLVRTYATALFEYTGQPIEYSPFRMADGDDDVEVKTKIDPGAGPKIPLNYSLAKTDDGNWRVYDVSIDGISLVTNYRSSYSREIKKGGLDGLIKKLSDKNIELAGK